MDLLAYFVFACYMTTLLTLSLIPHFLYTGKQLEDTHEPLSDEEENDVDTQEELDEETETEPHEEEPEQHEENYTQTENMILRRRTVIFNEKDGTTTIVTEYI
jgi:hypothetical protein